MHRGRNYPFFPEYWATEAWFWPGFVPWKMACTLGLPRPSPWTAMAECTDLVSELGTVVDDRTQISYHWPLDDPSTATDLYLSLELITVGDVRYARWKALLRTLGVETADAWVYQDYPQQNVYSGFQGFSLVNSPPPVLYGLALYFRPATYEEGGSPYSG